MTNSNTPPPLPALTLVEKLYAVHNSNSLVPEKLDLQESNYSTWNYFFKGHCSNFNVLNHIDGSTSTSDPPTDEWITTDSIVKSWIFLTLSPTLRKRMISTNPASAKAAWGTIETIFQENKRTRNVALKDAYFSKIDSIITLLTDLGSTMDDDDIVTYAINGLSEKYGSLAQIIAHKYPFPDLATVRTMVTTEEIRLRSKQPIISTSTTSSSPQVLLATPQPQIQDNRNNRDCDARNENKTKICRNFGRGQQPVQHNNTMGLRPNAPPGFQQTQPHQPTFEFNGHQQALYSAAVQNQSSSSGSTSQEIQLPYAFNTLTLQDPANSNWNMDTGASSYLNSSVNNLNIGRSPADVQDAFYMGSLSETVTSTTSLFPGSQASRSCLPSPEISLMGLKQAPWPGFDRDLRLMRSGIVLSQQKNATEVLDRLPPLSALKRILRMCVRTSPMEYNYSSTTSLFSGYSDADRRVIPLLRRSTSGAWSIGWLPIALLKLAVTKLLRELHTPLATAILVFWDNGSCLLPVLYGSTRPSRYQYAEYLHQRVYLLVNSDEFRTSLELSVHSAPTAGG
ncbi:hypothetical protein Tco_0294329 [Tanacetum coccineum]